MKRLGPLVIEPSPNPTAWVVVGVSTAAVLAAFLLGGFIFLAYGISPVEAYGTIIRGSLGDLEGLAQVVRRAIPLILVGVGLSLAYRAQFWNIGAEGQLLAGAVAAAGVALFVPVPEPLLLPAMFVAGGLAGALWGTVSALLRAQLGVNEVVSTLMMNYVALYSVDWLIHGPWKGRRVWGFAYSDTFPAAAWLPVLPGTQVHWPTLVLGLLVAAGATFLVTRTRFGYELRVLGHNPDAARYAGMDASRILTWVALLSAGAAGLAGAGEVAGIHHRLLGPAQMSLGYGYTGIIVAWLARGNPAAVVLTALLMGIIFAGGDVMKVALQMPFQVTNVFNGLILFFLIGTEPIMRFRVRRRRTEETAWTSQATPRASS